MILLTLLTLAAEAKPLTRLFVQDLPTSSLRWADVREDGKAALTLGPLSPVAGFPKLDPARQKLVQMKEAGGLLCVGVRDDADGAFASGWVVLRPGVTYADHGDHGHWSFKSRPEAIARRLDAKQGNPAHLYAYDRRFFLANDKLGGYTRLDPTKPDEPRFIRGGGGHITLAVVDDEVGYGCWIDGDGPNKGRVDVTAFSAKGEPAYSFHLPSGGIHGATANAGKVFFAPSDGVCWVEADAGLKHKGAVKVHHVSLGKDGERPRRTGAFVNHGTDVLFVAGPSLVRLDANDPKPVTIPLSGKKGTRPVTPVVAETPDGKAYAFVFHDRVTGAEARDTLDVVALGTAPKVVKTLEVGRSAVEGHSGHHDLAFDADRRYGFFTNPGDGTVSVLSLKTLSVVATFDVGGKPTAILAVGGRDAGG